MKPYDPTANICYDLFSFTQLIRATVNNRVFLHVFDPFNRFAVNDRLKERYLPFVGAEKTVI